jgi:3-hydroxyisobutyrate dehydrogenase
VQVWNRTQSKAGPLLETGAVWKASPAALAGEVDLLCLNVTDTPDVEAVLNGPDGVVSGVRGRRQPLIVVDHSTVSPDATRQWAESLKKLNVTFLDAPVTGGDIGAREGTLSIMVGGDAAAFEQALPMLQAVGKTITHVGPSGAGQSMKACNQIMGALNLLGVCEALALAHKEGLNLQQMVEVTSAGAAGSWALANLGPKIASGDLAPGFMVDLLLKDLEIVKGAGQGHELQLLGARLVADLFRVSSEMGHGKQGTQALSKVTEAMGKFRFSG